MQKIKDAYSKLNQYIISLDTHPSFQFFQRQHKIKLSQKLIPAVKYLIPFLLIVFPFQIFTIVFGYIYPAYLTITTFQNPNEESQNRILTYWMMFAFTQIITPVPQLIIPSFMWYFIRVLFLWLLLTGKLNISKKFQKWILIPLVKQKKTQKSEINKKNE